MCTPLKTTLQLRTYLALKVSLCLSEIPLPAFLPYPQAMTDLISISVDWFAFSGVCVSGIMLNILFLI